MEPIKKLAELAELASTDDDYERIARIAATAAGGPDWDATLSDHLRYLSNCAEVVSEQKVVAKLNGYIRTINDVVVSVGSLMGAIAVLIIAVFLGLLVSDRFGPIGLIVAVIGFVHGGARFLHAAKAGPWSIVKEGLRHSWPWRSAPVNVR